MGRRGGLNSRAPAISEQLTRFDRWPRLGGRVTTACCSDLLHASSGGYAGSVELEICAVMGDCHRHGPPVVESDSSIDRWSWPRSRGSDWLCERKLPASPCDARRGVFPQLIRMHPSPLSSIAGRRYLSECRPTGGQLVRTWNGALEEGGVCRRFGGGSRSRLA
jgi:hypothetical protein